MAEQQRLEVKLELLHTGDGRTYLNFWDLIGGQDIVCQIIDGKLIQDDENEHYGEEIPLQEFIDKVTEVANREDS